MSIKNKWVRRLFNIAIVIAVFECIYLFALPPVVNHFLSGNLIKTFFEKNTNASINYSGIKIKTLITPDIILQAESLAITDKENSYDFLEVKNFETKISWMDFLRKKVNIKNVSSDNLCIYLFQDIDGILNVEKLFPKKNNSSFKLIIKNNKIFIKDYNLEFTDKILDKKFSVIGNLDELNIKNKNEVSFKTNGYIVTDENKSDFDIDIISKYPFLKTFDSNGISGKFFIRNMNLELVLPYWKKYIDKKLRTISGYIDYAEFTTNEVDGINQNLINIKTNELVYDREDWSNDAHINGNCDISLNVESQKNKISINSLSIKADKIDIKSDGSIDLKDKTPELDINVEVQNSRAENIFAMLPENITHQLGTIEKVKIYGIYGDIEGKGNVKGKIPQPDITGYVKGRNVHALDKSIHKLHKGTIDITFDKRKLYMDILVELFGGQSAKIKGYTYMYRDGVNNVDIKTTNNIDFPLAQKIIIPVSKVFNFMLGPIVDMDITSGKGIIDLNVQGSIDTIAMNGYSEFRDAALTYNGLYGKVDKGIGRIDFKDDIIRFDSKQAYVKSNPLHIDGMVKINDYLDFNIVSSKADAKDVLEIINNSELLKDVKAGLILFTDADGFIKLTTNIKAKIVPVPFGQPPLPPEEAFEDMKVKGSVELFNDTCYIEGFKTPFKKISGIVDFTETDVDINPLTAMSGDSSIKISGKVINDIETKIPDVDIVVTSDSVNLKDTIKFLVESYLYPEDYPDLSNLYNIASKHDLYFKYKAKSIDFVTDKAYAVMNFIPDDKDDPIKAKSGKIIMDKAAVKVDNVVASLYDSDLLIDGNVKNIDTINPLYNLDIKTKNFNLTNLNDTSKISIIPQELTDILNIFNGYEGYADVDFKLRDNIAQGSVDLKKAKFIHTATNIPLLFDNFPVIFKGNKIILENFGAQVGNMPFFGNLIISDYYKNPDVDGFITLKVTDDFVKQYFSNNNIGKIDFKGDISISSKIKGTSENLTIEPKLVLNYGSDITYEGTNIGDINEKREIFGLIKILNNNIFIDNLEYVKYVSSQNNKVYPIKFMDVSGKLVTFDNMIIPEQINLKTYKNLPARFINIMLKSPILQQGTFNGDIKYENNIETNKPNIIGEVNFSNINIPLFDTVIRQIRIDSNRENINLSMFGFLSDEKISLKAEIKNDLSSKPQIESLNIYADEIDRNKLFEILSKVHIAMNTNNQIRNLDLAGLSITNGHLEIKKLIVKSFETKDFYADFSIDEHGIFKAKNIKTNIADGMISGNLSYNMNDTGFTGDFDLQNVDSNYVAETLFEGKNQIYGNANGKIFIKTKGLSDKERIKNLSGYVYFDISDGRMPKLGSMEYLLRASNILKSGITGFTINSILELLNLVKTGYFSNINGSCIIENGVAQDIEIFSKGENLSLYIHGDYDISESNANMEILGKLSKRISTIFGAVGNTSLNTFFKFIPGISIFDFSRKDFIEDVEKIPSFTAGEYDARVFQAIIEGNINGSGYVQSFKWVK